MIFRKKLRVKPVSVNEAWQLKGFRKFKSKKYNVYQKDIIEQLQGVEWPYDLSVELHAIYRVGFSNKLSDLDNAIKPIQDTLSGIFGWNDNKVYSFRAKKLIVPKGKEYINVAIFTRQMSKLP
jgi:Holliday junction resolvase RusA-like endonuclease